MSSSDLGQAVRFWWVRHGPLVAHDGTIAGQRERAVDLSHTDALAGLARALPQAAVVLASPLSRATLTAQALLGRDPDGSEAELLEQDFGRWSDCTWDEIGPEAAALGFWDDPVNHRPPGGESMAEHARRVGHFIERAKVQWPGRDVVCVCHAGTIRVALAHAMGLGAAAGPLLTVVIDPLSLTRTDALLAGGHVVSLVNQTFGRA